MCQKCKNDECGGCQRVVITKQGERGFPGAPGLKGDNGNIGAQGAKGDKGDQGDQGIQGDAGVDAAAIYDSIYLGWIEQFSTAGPAMTIPTNGNTLGAVVWTRNSVGHYIGRGTPARFPETYREHD